MAVDQAARRRRSRTIVRRPVRRRRRGRMEARMTVSAMTRFDVTDVTPKIGCRIETDKATLLSGAKVKEIRELMEKRGVVVFPEINLTDEEQIAFTHTLGVFAHEEGEGT